jgi:hypothetical protein
MKMRSKKSMWDILYDLYCITEYSRFSHISNEHEYVVNFTDSKCNQVALDEIRIFLRPKADKSYVRFLEFYNGLTLGQWVFLGAFSDEKEASLDVIYVYDCEAEMRENTPSDIMDKMLPIATNNDIMCYLSKTGEVFSLPWPDNKELYSQEPLLVNRSFEEFMNECVLGPRYLEFGKEDEAYRYLQWCIKANAELDRKHGDDKDENPTRDPRIVTSLREMGRDMARQTYEQTKGLPAGTKIGFS